MRGVLVVRWALGVLAVLAATGAADVQGPPRDGSITGRVVDASGKPVAGAIVSIDGAAARTVTVPGWMPGVPPIVTAADGRFSFGELPPGRYMLQVTKNGYAEGGYGRRRPGGPSREIEVRPGQTPAHVDIPIWKLGAIAGTVTDEAGEPVVGVQLRILSRLSRGGAKRLFSGGAPATTDDRGAYRFSGLMPGDYIVAVMAPRVALTIAFYEQMGPAGGGPGFVGAAPISGAISGSVREDAGGIQIGESFYSIGRGTPVPPPPVNGRLWTYPPTFYPAAGRPGDAAALTIGSGEERSGIDLQIQPVPTARVSGTLIGPDGPLPVTPVRLYAAGFEELPFDQEDLTTASDGSGRFVFPAVPAGQYMLRASTATRLVTVDPRAILWAAMSVSVSSDLDDLVVTLQPGLRVTARLEFDSSAGRTPPARPTASVALEPAAGPIRPQPNSAAFSPEGITVAGLVPGTYFVRVQHSPEGWMFKSAMLNGVDVSEKPFELTRDITDLVITFTDRWSGLGGTVKTERGDPLPAARVVVFPVNADGWINYGSASRRLRSAFTRDNGDFGISSLPPGDYYVVAVPEDQIEDWRDPSVLDVLARVATRVTIIDGEFKMIDLRTREVSR